MWRFTWTVRNIVLRYDLTPVSFMQEPSNTIRPRKTDVRNHSKIKTIKNTSRWRYYYESNLGSLWSDVRFTVVKTVVCVMIWKWFRKRRFLPRVHPAVDDRVVASVRHGEPVESEPDEGDTTPGRQALPYQLNK